MTSIPGAAPRPAGSRPALYVVLPVPVADVADTMARVAHGGLKAWACPYCFVEHHQLNSPTHDAPCRTDFAALVETARRYAAAQQTANPSLAKSARELLNAFGLRDDVPLPAYRRVQPSMNIPWSSTLDFFLYMPYELLHGWLVGIYKHLQVCLFAALPASSYRALCHNLNVMKSST